MALNKIIEHISGVNMEYWKIAKVDLNYLSYTGSILLLGYTSQEARQQNKVPLETKVVLINNSNFNTWFALSVLDQENNNQIKNGYNYLKSIDGGDFFNSTDI
jgi:hypothetical protein